MLSKPFIKKMIRHVYYNWGLSNHHWLVGIVLLLSLRNKSSLRERLKNINLRKPTRAFCDGIAYDFFLIDDVQKSIFFNLYEKNELAKIAPFIKPGGTYLDIGANIGFYSLAFAKKLNLNGKVYAFEPNPKTYAQLQRNCCLNTFAANIFTYNLAVSNQEKTIPFYYDKVNSGSATAVFYEDMQGKVEKTEVSAITLDKFIEKEKIAQIELIKIDVEGHEIELLEGAKQALAAKIFKAIQIEFNGQRLHEQGIDLNHFLMLFKENKYRLVEGNDIVEKFLKNQIHSQHIFTNFIFTAEE